MFRTVSQVNVNYRVSSLSRGRVGSVHSGDRLPWVKTGAGGTGLDDVGEDNFAPLKSLDWQLHVYGDAAPEVKALSLEKKLPLHIFPWCAEMKRSGLRRDALYLVRPDGYVAVAVERDCAETVRSLCPGRTRIFRGLGYTDVLVVSGFAAANAGLHQASMAGMTLAMKSMRKWPKIFETRSRRQR